MLLAVMFLRSVVCSMMMLCSTGFYTAGGSETAARSFVNHNSFKTSTVKNSAAGSLKLRNEMPVNETVAAGTETTNTMVLMISGDSGWNSFDQETASQFAEQGIPVVGLNSLKYFWHKKDLSQITEDVRLLIDKYTALWNKRHIILVGYSFGADVVPFIYNRLSADIQNRVASIGLLSPSESTDFEVHLSEIFNIASTKRQFNVPEEIARITSAPVTCFFGKQEAHIAASALPKECNVVYVQGGHRYQDSFATIYDNIVR